MESFPSGKAKEKDSSKSKEKLKVVVVNVDELAEDAARDAAERHLTASKEESRGIKGFFKKMWKHGIAREYYRQKELARSRAAIAENEDVYAAENDPQIEKTAHQDAMRTIVDRFASEYQETLHAGESKEDLDKEGHAQLHDRMVGIIKEYASGTMNDQNFAEARTRILNELSEDSKSTKKNGMYADNLLDVAKQVRKAVEHGTKLDDLDLELDIRIGKAKNAIRTQANYNAADKVIEALKKTPVGVLVNEATLATGVATAYALTVGLTRSALSSRAASILTFGGSALIAGGFTGFAENKRLKEDRRQHAREMAQGRTYEKGSPRREEMDRYAHNMQEASLLSASIRDRLYETDARGVRKLRKLTETDQRELIAHIADIEARISLADQQAIDLISYSHATKVEQERLDLDIARAEAKAELRKVMEGAPRAKPVDYLVDIASLSRMRALTEGEGGIEEKNELFNKMKRAQVARAAVKGAAIGLVFGSVVQEGTAFLNDSQVGLTEHLIRGDAAAHEAGALHATPAEWLRGYLSGNLPPGDAPSHMIDIGNGNVRLPDDMDLVPSDHGFKLVEGDRVLLDGLTADSDGTLDAESLDQLAAHGFSATSQVENVTHEATRQVSAASYVEHHSDLTTHVNRELWFDNDTPAPKFDKNELRLWWGGEGNTGRAADGSYSFTVDHMLKGGSYHHGLSGDAQELVKEGKLKMLFSLSEDTQATPIEVPIGADGSVHIDPDSEAGKLLFKTVDGHAQFMGRFAEVAEVTNTDAVGEHVRILATYEGEGLPHVPDTVSTTVPEPVTVIDTPHDYRLDPPPIIPWFGRTPLEPTAPGTPRTPKPLISAPPAGFPAYYGYGSGSPKDLWGEMQRAGATFDSYYQKITNGKISWVDKEGNPVRRDVAREQRRMRAYLDAQDSGFRSEIEGYAKSIGPMHERCRLAINIPARFEEKNLTNLLDQYVAQVGADGKPLDPNLFEINILVNRKVGEPADGSINAIAAWKAAHPGYRVNAIDIEFPADKANVGMARKYVTDVTLLRASERPKSAGPLYIETEDADLYSVDKRTVATVIEKFDSAPQLDVLRGMQDRRPEILQKNDLLLFERRLWDFMEIFMRKQAYRPERLQGSSFVWNRVISGGWNTAYTAEAYAQIGGYVPDLIGEDMKIGQKISLLRGYQDGKEYIPNTQTAAVTGLRSNSSPRRFIDAMSRQITPYADFENQSLKEKSLDELLEGAKEYAQATVEQKGKYEGSISLIAQFIAEQLPQPHAQQVLIRTLGYMGLRNGKDYTLTGNDNTITLTDGAMPRIIELLKRYKDEGRSDRGYKRQNRPLNLDL